MGTPFILGTPFRGKPFKGGLCSHHALGHHYPAASLSMQLSATLAPKGAMEQSCIHFHSLTSKTHERSWMAGNWPLELDGSTLQGNHQVGGHDRLTKLEIFLPSHVGDSTVCPTGPKDLVTLSGGKQQRAGLGTHNSVHRHCSSDACALGLSGLSHMVTS